MLLDDSAAQQRRRNRQDALKSYYSLADEPTASSSTDRGTTTVTGLRFCEPENYMFCEPVLGSVIYII